MSISFVSKREKKYRKVVYFMTNKTFFDPQIIT